MTDQPTSPAERHAGAARVIQNRLIARIAGMTEAELKALSSDQVVRMWRDAVEVEKASAPDDPASLARLLGLDDEPTGPRRDARGRFLPHNA
jgi:hypothetical protein